MRRRICQDPAPSVAGSVSSVAGSGSSRYGLSNTTWFDAFCACKAQKSLFLAKSRLLPGQKPASPVTLVPGYSRYSVCSRYSVYSRGSVPLEFPYCFWCRRHLVKEYPGIPGIPGIHGTPGSTLIVGPTALRALLLVEYGPTGLISTKSRRAVS